ncbi:MAG: sigma-54-dependent Fis family transcriptional regulator, partial [Bdellovibrionota bacterium]
MSDFDKAPILPTADQGQTLVPQAKMLEDNPIIYKSEMMRQLMKMVERVAPAQATVLVLGES